MDGSAIKTLVSLAEAAYLRDRNGSAHSGWRFHTHFEIDRGIRVRVDLTTALYSGKSEEKNQLQQRLKKDRWYAEFVLWNLT